MQGLWSKILAEEANALYTFSRQAVNTLSNVGRMDAVAFTNLCNFAWNLHYVDASLELVPLVFDNRWDTYNSDNINKETLYNLESLGLIRVNSEVNKLNLGRQRKFSASYFGRNLEFDFPEDSITTLNLGQVQLTAPGKQLARICGRTPKDDFFSLVSKNWMRLSWQIQRPSPRGEV